MRISDWSSDVCSSDLPASGRRLRARRAAIALRRGSCTRAPLLRVDRAGYRSARPSLFVLRLSGQQRRRLGDLLLHRARRDTEGRGDVVLTQMFEPIEDEHGAGALRQGRSEEHTSELQSLMRISYAVFCLKKK